MATLVATRGAAAKKAAVVKKSAAPKKAVPVKKAAGVKKSAAPKKAVPVKKAAGVKKAVPVKKAAAVKKSAAVKKAVPVGKALPARKAVPAKKAAPAKKAIPVTKPAAIRKPATVAKAAPAASKPAVKRGLLVREDESPWTTKELGEVRSALHRDHALLLGEIANAEAGLADLIRDSGDGAGDDQADAGSKTFEREHEMSLANNARDMLAQVQHALDRIDAKTYGTCESCGKAIGKLRLQAFPRATLCMSCKQAEERH